MGLSFLNKVGAFTALIICMIVYQSHATLLFTENWSSGLGSWKQQGGCYPYAYTIVNDPCDSTNKVLRIEMRVGDTVEACASTNPWHDVSPKGQADPSTYYPYKHRNELGLPFSASSSVTPAEGQNWWMGYRFRLAETFPTTSILNWVTFQSVPASDGEPADGPDLDIRPYSTGWKSQVRTNDAIESTSKWNKADGPALARGEWVNVVIHHKRSMGTNGILQIWHNGVLWHNYTGQSTQNYATGSLVKFGFYLSTVKLSQPSQTYIALFDSVKVAEGTSEYNTVVPSESSGPCTAPPDPDPPDPPAPTAVITQSKYQFYERFLDEGDGPLVAADTPITSYVGGRTTLRLATVTTEANADEFDFKLFWRKNGGSWAAITTTTTDAVYLVDNPARANDDPLTSQLPRSCRQYASKGAFKDADADAITAVLQQDTQSEWEYSLGIGSDASEGDVIELRLEQSDSTDLDAYTVTPSITVTKVRSAYYGGNK